MIHLAAEPEERIQECAYCHSRLLDYTACAPCPPGESYAFFLTGTHVDRGPTYLRLTDLAPNCIPEIRGADNVKPQEPSEETPR
jgi:hypothetical protein